MSRYYFLKKSRLNILITIAVSLAMIISLWWVASHGRVSVYTGDPKIEPLISILNLDGDEIKSVRGYSFSDTLPIGRYVIRVNSGMNTAEKSISVGRFLQNTDANVNVIDSKYTIPVTNLSIYKPHPLPSGMRFIESTVWRLGEFRDGEMRYYGVDNAIDALWIDDESGFIVSQDRSTNKINLYRLQGMTTDKIDTPQETSLPISIAYHDQVLYLQIENTLYSYRNGIFSELLTTPDNSRVVAATDKLIAIISRGGGDNKDQVLNIYSQSGELRKHFDIGTSETFSLWSSAAISGDGTSIAVGSQGLVTVYSTDTLDPIYSLPNNSVSALTWDGSRLLYATNNILWQYDQVEKLSQSITELNQYSRISTILSHNDDIYIIDQRGDKSSLLKVANEGDDSSYAVDVLNGSETTFVNPGCYFNFYFQNTPTIFIHQEIDDISRCIPGINDYLASIAVNPADIIVKKSSGYYNPY